jgi:endoglucanase
MDRRDFSKAAAAFGAVGSAVFARGRLSPTPAPAPGPAPAPTTAPAPTPAPTSGPVPSPAPAPGGVALGVNLSGMEWAESGHRFGSGTLPNLHFTVPRASDVAYLASQGFTRSRLPIKWEFLQPMLHDTVANAAARAAIGEPGAFHAAYESYITAVLDAHAAVGTKCIIDLHNYCRYRDFIFQPDGSVTGLVAPANPLIRAFTTDNSQVQTRIMALAPGATLKQAHFADFWRRAALKWKDHPGFGGYGLMNEPYNMPAQGETTETFGGGQDVFIWPQFAVAAIQAIRAVDPTNPVYLGGNEWSSAMAQAYVNPAFPLEGYANIIYEVHMYLDAFSNGQSFDYDYEVSKKYTAGFGNYPIGPDTGANRLKLAIDWAEAYGVKLALTETGMPIDDPRWEEEYRRLMVMARAHNVEVYSWLGGNHWTLHNRAINHVPGWHQNKTLEPAAAGPMKASAGISKAVLFADGPGWAPSGTPVTITVYARGALSAPVTITVASNNAGTLSKSTLTIPAGANGQDTFTFTAGPNRITTLSFTSSNASFPAPAPRKVYSLTDPVAYAATNLADAAMAIIARYGACKWELADGYTDYMGGGPAAAGQHVRAIADSGYGSGVGNAMEMLNWINNEMPGMGTTVPPVMRVVNNRKNSDHSAPDTFGFWCRKTVPVANLQPNPRNKVPYNIQDAHFAVAALSVPGVGNTGAAFQASNASEAVGSEIAFNNSVPQARWTDGSGSTLELTGSMRLATNVPAVVSFTSVAGAQRLRVDSAVVASAALTFAPAVYDQLLLGWGFRNFYPEQGFGGNLYGVITGKGAPTTQELEVLERYLATVAGVSGTPAPTPAPSPAPSPSPSPAPSPAPTPSPTPAPTPAPTAPPRGGGR